MTPIVQEGTWLYDGITPLRVRILKSPVMWGSHTPEDPPEIRDDRYVDCFEISYEDGSRRISGAAAQTLTLEEAVAWVERMFAGITWSPSKEVDG